MRSIGRRVRKLRQSFGFSQVRMADESGVAKSTLSKLESGQQLSSLAVLELFARCLGVELLDLVITPDADHPRHQLIDATRDLPPETLRALLEIVRRFATPPSAAAPSDETPRPRR